MLPAADVARQSPQLDTIAARGHTVLRQVSADGIEQVSAGDVLDAKFRPKAGRRGQPQRRGRGSATASNGGVLAASGGVGGSLTDSLASALQQGHIAMMRRVPAKPGAKTGDDVFACDGGAGSL